VNTATHTGWTGNVLTSWKGFTNQHSPGMRGVDMTAHTASGMGKDELVSKTHPSLNPNNQSEIHGGSLYNGDKWVLYWSDVTSEIAFVVPTGKSSDWSETAIWNLSEPGIHADRNEIFYLFYSV